MPSPAAGTHMNAADDAPDAALKMNHRRGKTLLRD